MSVASAQARVVRLQQAIAGAQAELVQAEAERDVELAGAGWFRVVPDRDIYDSPTFANPQMPLGAVLELLTRQEAAV